MEKSQIFELLKTVTYPGYSKNIVDFGMVSSVNEGKTGLIIDLHIVSKEDDKLSKIKNQVTQVLSSNDLKVESVNIKTTPKKIETQSIKTNLVNKDPMDDQKRFEFADQVIAVSSGKGGVGKSTVAANLALSLYAKGHKVGLLDLDVYGPSIPMLFNITEPPMVEDEHTIHSAKKYGIELMSFGFFIGEQSPVIWRGPLVMKLVDQFLSDVKWSSKLDYLIIDMPPGTGDVQLSLSQKIVLTGAVIVTTPQDLALVDVSRGANMFQKMNVPVLGVIENMSYYQCTKCGHKEHVFSSGGGKKESTRLNVPFLGHLPLSKSVMTHSDIGKPIVIGKPDSEESKAFKKIVETLLEKMN